MANVCDINVMHFHSRAFTDPLPLARSSSPDSNPRLQQLLRPKEFFCSENGLFTLPCDTSQYTSTLSTGCLEGVTTVALDFYYNINATESAYVSQCGSVPLSSAVLVEIRVFGVFQSESEKYVSQFKYLPVESKGDICQHQHLFLHK